MSFRHIFARRVAIIGLRAIVVAFGFALCCGTHPARAQQAADEIDVLQLRPNFYMIGGAGGNIALETGPEGSILVNAGTAAGAELVVAAIKRVTNQPVRYIIDTSADPDLVGGNAILATKAGRNIIAAGPQPLGNDFQREMTNNYAATIVSSEQVLFRMSAPNGQKAPYPSEAWPGETFPDRRKDYYMNREGIQIYREPAAHSDGDTIVLFRGSDVVVAGDVIDANHFPVIDLAKGGSIQGEIEALNQIVDLSFRPMPFVFTEGGTYVIPGHGRLYDRQDVVEYRDMVVTIRDIIQDMIQRGMTLPQIKEASPAKAYEREYGAKSGPWTTEDFVEAVYKGLIGKK